MRPTRSMTVREVINQLEKFAKESPYGDDTTVTLALQEIEYHDAHQVQLEVDSDGGALIVIQNNWEY